MGVCSGNHPPQGRMIYCYADGLANLSDSVRLGKKTIKKYQNESPSVQKNSRYASVFQNTDAILSRQRKNLLNLLRYFCYALGRRGDLALQFKRINIPYSEDVPGGLFFRGISREDCRFESRKHLSLPATIDWFAFLPITLE